MIINVMITDDHPMVLAGLEKTFAGYSHIQLLAAFKDGQSLLAGLKNVQPDVLLLDVQLPDIPGPQLAREIHKTYPKVRILALTGLDTSFHAFEMLQNGCKGFLLKHSEEAVLIEAIEYVHSGRQFIDNAMKDRLLNDLVGEKYGSEKRPNLTVREKEVLQLIISGKTSAEIAETLFISIRTAENHRFSIMQKLDVKNTAGLVNLAFKLGLTS